MRVTDFFNLKLFIFTFTLPLDIVHFRSPFNPILSIKVTIIRHNKVLRWRSTGAGSSGNIKSTPKPALVELPNFFQFIRDAASNLGSDSIMQ